MEHFDSVQIFASRHGDDEKERVTFGNRWGEGNFFARFGQVKMWIKENEASPGAVEE
jgi:hypothetical protein